MDTLDPTGKSDTSYLAPALTAGVTVGATMLAVANRTEGGRLVDDLADIATFASNNTYAGIGHTFRFREFTSPWHSAQKQAQFINQLGMTGVSANIADDTLQVKWDKSFFHNPESVKWLQEITGLSEGSLAQQGIGGLAGDPATELVFERGLRSEGGRGSLYAVRDGSKSLLSDSIAIMEATNTSQEALDILTQTEGKGFNPAFKGVMQALDHWRHGHSVGKVFQANVPTAGAAVSKWANAPVMPVPSAMPGPQDLAGLAADPSRIPGHLRRRAALARSVPAAGMERLNRLIGQTIDMIPDGKAKDAAKMIGIGRVRPGPASIQYLRYGGMAAKVGAVALGVQQVDWFRGFAGGYANIPVSGLVSAGVGAAAKKLGASNRVAFGAAAASFFGQTILPGFDEGILPGIASTYAMFSTAAASDLNPVNHYRRTLEGFLPGVSGVGMGALFAFGAVAATGAHFGGRTLVQHGFKAAGWGGNFMPSANDMWKQELGKAGFKGGYLGFAEDIRDGRVMARVRASNDAWQAASLRYEDQYLKSPAAQEYIMRTDVARQRMLQSNSSWGKFRYEAQSIREDVRAAFFGVDANKVQRLTGKKYGKLSGRLGRATTIGTAAFALHQIFTGAAFGSMETSEELRQLYEGRKLVEVRSGRWWLFGSREFGGDEANVSYRPSLIAQWRNKTADAWMWGEDHESISPVGKFFRKNFTYDLERRQAMRDPSVISSAAFEDVPVLGPILAATIGRIIKPTRTIRGDEWQDPEVYGSHALGEPVDPNAFSNRAAQVWRQFTDFMGLWGWAANTVIDSTYGDSDFIDERPYLQSSAYKNSAANAFWQSELGDPGYSEALRRFLPRQNSYQQDFNPLLNNQPSWMPYKFRVGSPSLKAGAGGTALLPGPALAKLYPELEGLAPEEYPAIYKLRVLSALAPKSREYQRTLEQVYRIRQTGAYNEKEEAWIDQMSAEAERVIAGYEFERVHENAYTVPIVSDMTQAVWFRSWQAARETAAPLEYSMGLFGFRPFQKFTGDMRDPLEQYRYEMVYGSARADWQKPWRDWFRPALYSALGNNMPGDFKPAHVQNVENTNEYFDKLEFYKHMRDGNYRAAAQTRYGVNPNGSIMGIYWSMPIEQRRYLKAFMQATSASERRKILKLVPEDHRHLYEALWERADAGEDLSAVIPRNTDVDPAYLQQQFHEVMNYFNEHGLPGEDWVGFHDGVDVDDVRLLYINETAGDIHEHNVWEKQVRYARTQQEAAAAANDLANAYDVRPNAGVLGWMYRGRGSDIVVTTDSDESSAEILYGDDRSGDIQNVTQRWLQ